MQTNEPSDALEPEARDDPAFSIEEIAARYADRLIEGEKIERQEILATHPTLGPEIVEHLDAFAKLTRRDHEEKPLGSIGDYRLVRRLGRGGMGIVYEAWQESMERRVALKMLPAGLADDERAFHRFLSEAKTAGKLHHPNIVGVYGMGMEDGVPYYAMELVEGETLGQLLKRRSAEGSIAADARYYIDMAESFAGAADGLQHAHSLQVVHRDIKPSNLIFDGSRGLRILDFGLARTEGGESMTVTGEFVGTLAYMSPEQARAKKIPLDARTDIYSLGATMYEAVTGRPPFRGKNRDDTLTQIITRDPDPPSKLNPRAPRDLETIVLKCLRKEPEARYLTAEAVAQDLRRFVRSDPIEARPQAGWEKAARKAWRGRWKIAFAAVVAFAALVSGLLYLRHSAELVREARATARAASLKLYTDMSASTAQLDVAYWEEPVVARKEVFEQSVADLTAAALVLRDDPGVRYLRARILLRIFRRFDEALKDVDKALAIDDRFVPARAWRAFLLERRDDAEAAARELRLARAQADVPWKAAWLDMHEARTQARWKDVVPACTSLLELEAESGEPYLGSSVEARMERGFALLEIGDAFRALDDFSKGEVFWPGAIEPTLAKAMAYYRLGQKETSASVLKDLHDRSDRPDDTRAWIWGVYRAVKDYPTALEWVLRPSTGRPPGYEPLRWLLLGITLNDLGRWAESDEWLRKAADALPQPAILSNVGAFLHNHGRFEESRTYLERAVRLDPNDTSSHALLAWTLISLDTLDDALREAQEALRLWRRNAFAWLGVGVVHRVKRRFEESEEALRRSVTLDPKRSLAYWHLGNLLCDMGRTDEGLAQLRHDAYDLRPNSPYGYSGLGWCLFQAGRKEEALRELEKAVAVGPECREPYEGLGDIHGQSHERALAFEPYTRCLEIEPRSDYVHRHLWPLFIHEEAREGGTAEVLQRLKATTEKAFADGAEDTYITATLALVRGHEPGGNGISAALELAGKAVEKSSRGDPDILAVLAQVQSLAGRAPVAVSTLEEALELAAASEAIAEQLSKCRESVLPELPTYASVDAAVEGSVPDLAVNAVAAPPLRLYLEGRLRAVDGEHEEAGRKFAGAAALDPQRAEPVLRLAECLRRTGDPASAEARLREAIAHGAKPDRELREQWAAVSLGDLGRSPAELLASVPAAKDDGPGDDVSWLLERLSKDETLRINCGGKDYEAPDGTQWSRDRFFRGGSPGLFVDMDIRETDIDQLYLTERYFRLKDRAGYRVPLPRGTYRVTLHFAEYWYYKPGARVFGVRIEGSDVLPRYEPRGKGFATAEQKAFEEIQVEDGLLEIEFVHQVEYPKVSGIEIKRVR